MVDSRDKGSRAETVVRDILRLQTKLKWERVPGSGALNEKHGLKGDLYVPNEKNLYCVEVKHYAEDHLTSALLTGKSPQLIEWWSQAVRQGIQVNRKPLLLFKHDRSKIFAAYEDMPSHEYRLVFVSVLDYNFYVSTLTDWLDHETPKFIT
jgi:hypothetical protein